MQTTRQTDVAALTARVHELMPRARHDLTELVSYRSVADARVYPAEECAKTARWVADAFSATGLSTRLLTVADGSTAVYGERPGPAGSPTVLLYCHYDVQPPLSDTAWRTPPFELTEVDGRWYGRGTADCKGNIVAHLTALRALDGAPNVGVKVIAEGSEEQGTGGLEEYVAAHPDLLRADEILVADCGNATLGQPTFTTSLRGTVLLVVTMSTMDSELHSGMFGGPAPDALAALIRVLATLRDGTGDTTVRGLRNDQTWPGVEYPEETFRRDAHVLDGVSLTGTGTVADRLWARPAVTVLGIDAPKVVGSSAAIQPTAAARINLRVPPGTDAHEALDALRSHLVAATPWHAKVDVTVEAVGQPFRATTTGPAYRTMSAAMRTAFGTDPVESGQGGSIPLCTVFADTYPEAEIMLLGVEEPACLIHAPNESVSPGELERMALTEALYLSR
ncbi:dipeptidase [Actinocatenispora rupis]|uniref:Dipeptidase n=1 Tax=Actinocatenispora rupis TaxID=519421 RepID=A0A8J3N982_9ACTN|nr:dipeptidase [Actinocatenispora rupis]GID10866.1 dipeptidase [Actinocatenispora rupis]